jgi:dynactin complex subunit
LFGGDRECQWVRYRGPVHYGEGEWVGVELEEKVGKNNGTLKVSSPIKV